MTKRNYLYKYEHYIKDFLLRNGEVSLEQIGTFTHAQTTASPTENRTLDCSAIKYQYNKKAATTAALLDFIAQKEMKNRQIISIDFESYLNEMRQLINTGKEVAIDGLGFLHQNNNLEYEFVHLSPATVKTESARRKIQYQDIDKFKKSSLANRKGSLSVVLFSLLVIVLFIGAAAWGIYSLFFNKPDTNIVTSVNIPEQTANDSTKKTPVTLDTSAKQAIDTAVTNSDSAEYKFIFETTSDKSRAYSRVAKLKEYGDPAALDSVQTDTALLYRLFVVKKILNADTAQTRDSIQKYFQRNIIIAPNK